MIILDGARLTPWEIAAVARDRVPVGLSDGARARNATAREVIAAGLESGEPLYGASTGVGALRDREVGPEDRERFQWNLLRSHAVSAGRPLEPDLVRAGMVVRANQLGTGGAGVAPELLERLVWALNENVVPVTGELGSLGTGDLPGLAEIALVLLGEHRIWRDGKPQLYSEAVDIRLGLRDALGFMSSNALTAGRAALVCVDSFDLLERWLSVAALSFEALQADPVVLDERVQAARGSSGQSAVAARMRELLAGASLAEDDPNRLVQDPYPFRVLPQVDGVSHDAVVRLGEVVTRECNSRGENALIVDSDRLPNGNFHEAELAAALDALRAALASSASLIAARISAMLDPRITGLSPFLAQQPGLDSGVMMLEYTAQAASAEARLLATPMSTQTIWASLGVESHASLAATAAGRAGELLEAMDVLVAIELVMAVRALRLSGRRSKGAGTEELFDAAALAFPETMKDRALGREIERAQAVLREYSRTRGQSSAVQ
ncbi:MAG: aromatic amino acid ammonia-lyase [Actinomycetota bacterium]|nr:aromatic amino acid ammonia-lyase [Actinomycetota bacterium]